MDFSAAWSVVFLLNVLCFGTLRASEWNYNASSPEGPDHWKIAFPTCGGVKQSPINIGSTVAAPQNVSGLVLTGYDRAVSHQFTLSNNGHSAVVSVKDSSIKISGAGLGATYTLEQFHFHWGESSSSGSEHLVNSTAYPLEIHLVHYNSDKYSSFSVAASQVNDTTALAVLGIFVLVTSDAKRAPTELGTLISQFPKIAHQGNQTQVDSFALNSILPCDKSMFRYSGSLTTPGCSEIVIWTVFQKPIYITESQLSQFRELYFNPLGEDDEKMSHNFRPTQPINDRFVYAYSDTMPRCGAPGLIRPSAAAAAVATILAAITISHLASRPQL